MPKSIPAGTEIMLPPGSQIWGVNGVSGKYLEQYFQPFAMEEQAFAGIYQAISQIDLGKHIAADGAFDPDLVAAATANGIKAEWVTTNAKASGAPSALYTLNKSNGVALFEVRGTLTKYGSSFSSVPAMTKLSAAIRQASRDPEIQGIVVAIDSPGGTSAGSTELSDEIGRAAAKKPVYAWFDDLGASAAYRIACQATKVFASRDAMVGSIGTYMVVTDWSRHAVEMGAKVHVIRAGEFKGAGTPGTEITEKQLARWQEMVNDINAGFLADVAKGRKLSMEQVQTLADGRVYVAKAAQESGLIDGIRTLEEVLGECGPPKKGKRTMSEATNDDRPKAATIKELKASFPQASEKFVLDCLEKDFSMEQAGAAWREHLQAENVRLTADNTRLTAELAEANEKIAKAKTGLNAVEGNADPAQGAGTVYEDWQAKMAERQKGGMNASQAMKAVDAEHPGLRQRALDEFNSRRPGKQSA